MLEEVEDRRARSGLLLLDIPLLYERPRLEAVEVVVVVWVDAATQLKRLLARGGLDEEAARARIEAQMPLDQKKALADHVIDNRGTREETGRQVEALFALFKRPK
jgi:dephospho-CoA kinase